MDAHLNYWTGLIFIVALFVGSWQLGVFGLPGTGLATVTAQLLGAPRERIEQGLEGFNDPLIGIALALYLDARSVTV